MKVASGLKFKACRMDGEGIIVEGKRITINDIEEDENRGMIFWIVFVSLWVGVPLHGLRLYLTFRDDLFGANGIRSQIQGWLVVLTLGIGLLLLVWYGFRMVRFRSYWKINREQTVFGKKFTYLLIEKKDDAAVEGRLKNMSRSLSKIAEA